MPRVPGGSQGGGCFLRARYPCTVSLTLQFPVVSACDDTLPKACAALSRTMYSFIQFPICSACAVMLPKAFEDHGDGVGHGRERREGDKLLSTFKALSNLVTVPDAAKDLLKSGRVDSVDWSPPT